PEPAALSAEIARFLEDTHSKPDERRSFWRQLVREHWVEKVASLAFVSALWMAVVPGSRPLERTFSVPGKGVHLPPALVLDDVKPDTIELTLSGLRREFYLFTPRFLRLTIDAKLADQGRRTFQVLRRDLRYPEALRLEGIDPDEVRINVHQAPPPE